MGAMNAEGFAQAVGEVGLPLDVALVWHLTANHYPPHPTSMVPVARKAIELVNDGEWDTEVALPEGATFRGQTAVAAGTLVEALHLEYFLSNDEEE